MRRHKWEVPEFHSGRWTRSDYINGADAIPLASVIEFTLATNVGQDFYDVRLVDGFNLPLSITPQGRPASCSATSCAANMNPASHPELQVKGSDGSVIACKRACLAFNQPPHIVAPALIKYHLLAIQHNIRRSLRVNALRLIVMLLMISVETIF
ncbi:hypothetical protein Gohar_025189 [Gossypium harknessii]|uniref:Uncharacterized protein n=1 Tax=Gossypium harknessii TaxID=34285 RepID=A0A7J9HJE2_9ROSI|nr:hypothetical protein [Gossypium harknessii]